jgi:hypothetical protein
MGNKHGELKANRNPRGKLRLFFMAATYWLLLVLTAGFLALAHALNHIMRLLEEISATLHAIKNKLGEKPPES